MIKVKPMTMNKYRKLIIKGKIKWKHKFKEDMPLKDKL